MCEKVSHVEQRTGREEIMVSMEGNKELEREDKSWRWEGG